MSTALQTHVREQRITPQSQPMPGKAQVPNSAGGFTFQVDDWMRFERFLILGSEGGSYYATERKLTRDNAAAVERCIKADGARAVAMIASISHAGRAPKNDQALFALALALAVGDNATKALAIGAVPRVVRTGTHLFQLAEFARGFRGWGPVLVKAFRAGFYGLADLEKVAFQTVKYASRNGWSHRDLLRLCHAKATFEDRPRRALFEWLTHPERLRKDGDGAIINIARRVRGKAVYDPDEGNPDFDVRVPPIVAHAVQLRDKTGDERWTHIAAHNLPREVVPTEWQTDPKCWAALFPGMPMTALIRTLGRMTKDGFLTPLSAAEAVIVKRLGDVAELRRARIHPLALLVAARTYGRGHGDKGSLTWTPNQPVCRALEDAFYLAFQAVEPTDKRHLLALDVSGSMSMGQVAGMGLTPREAAAAMALVTLAAEKRTHLVGFTNGGVSSWMSPETGGRSMHATHRSGISQLDIQAGQRLDQVCAYTEALPFGGTDCALPMLYAAELRLEVDAFILYTDHETWAGSIHPMQALQRYRRLSGIPAKLITVGFVSNNFSIADPNDAGALDCVGFDTAAPAVMADFIRS